MSTTAGVLHLVLGIVYAQYGTMTMIEMHRQRAMMGFSTFGAAWIAMAFTCGPHHFFHGVHILFEGRTATALDLVTVAIALPSGLLWFGLRVEAFRGGRGDRHIAGSPRWVLAMPTLVGMYVAVVVTTAFHGATPDPSRLPGVAANGMLVVLYAMVAYYVGRTQIANRRPLGGWSASGLSLTMIFVSCALSHGVGALHTATGRYEWDVHMGVIDIIGVPAAIGFVLVVRALQRGTFRDWNEISRKLGGDEGTTGNPVVDRADAALA